MNTTPRRASSMSPGHENTRNVLVILLGWFDATPRQLAQYNSVYDKYEDCIARSNKLSATNQEKEVQRVNIIVKQYVAPKCYIGFNLFMLRRWSVDILQAIKAHRESFGDSSHIIMHSFGTGGTLILSAMNEVIADCDAYPPLLGSQSLLFYDGIIYDSPYLGPLGIGSWLKIAWLALHSWIRTHCLCCSAADAEADAGIGNDELSLGCRLCSFLWYWINCAVFVALFLLVCPLLLLAYYVWQLATCSLAQTCCHHRHLMGVHTENMRLLHTPILVMGSDSDSMNPLRKSIQFLETKIETMQQVTKRYQQQTLNVVSMSDGDGEVDEETALLPVTRALPTDKRTHVQLNAMDAEFVKESNRYHAFEDSGHCQHFAIYPKQYQREVNRFLNLCLDMKMAAL